VKLATKRSKFGLLVPDEEHQDDFAHPLHVLYQISPSWSMWRPHDATLSVLVRVLARLESGMPARPMQPNYEGQLVEEEKDEDETKRRARINLAAEIMDRIYTNYPNTVGIVKDHERRKHRNRYSA